MGEGKEEVKDEEMKKEEEEEEEAEEPEPPLPDDLKSEPPSEDEPEPIEDDPPKVELSEEEKAMQFFPNTVPDLTPLNLSTGFVKFSIPEKNEGFDEIRCSWANNKQVASIMKDWIPQKKITTRI